MNAPEGFYVPVLPPIHPFTPINKPQIHRFEVTWLGLHAFREVFGAYSRKHKGFARPTAVMHQALVEAERDSALDGATGSGELSAGIGRRLEEGQGGRRNARRHCAYARLRGVARAPDAVKLLQTLTAGD